MKKSLLIYLFIANILMTWGQNKATLKGIIQNNKGQALSGVNIYIKNKPQTGTVTDKKGYFEIKLPREKQQLVIDYLGYKPQTISADIQKDKYLIIKLTPENNQLNTLIINVKESRKKELKRLIGLSEIKLADLKNVPMLLGELDVLKAIQVLPGVKAVSEGSAGFSVHGGSQDQNLILLDGAPVYHPSHILGFFSVFTPDIIKNLKFYKSAIPSRFGNRLSSILEVNTRQGNKSSYHLGGGVGIIASQLYAEGPLQKNKSSFLLAARQSYGDLWLPLLNFDAIKDVKAGFYDLNLKLNFELSTQSDLKISAYTGRDHYIPNSNFKMNYGNTVGSIIWKRHFNRKLIGTTALIYSKYDYLIRIKDRIDHVNYDFDIGLAIESPNFKQDFKYRFNPKNTFNFGLDTYWHTIKPGKIKNSRVENHYTTYPVRQAAELDFYFQHQIQFNTKFRLTYGLRNSNFAQLGPHTFYKYNDFGETVDTLKAGQYQSVKTYHKWAPHATLHWQMNPKSAVKLSYDRTYQFLHYLINDAATTTPTDLWLPSSINLKPQISDAFSLEINHLLGRHYFLSIGGYYRKLQNITDYKIGTTLSLADNIESDLLQQKGRAYGLEFLFKKTKGQLTGSLAYTYSKSEKIHPEINEGHWYPAVVDRPIDISVLLNYKVNQRLELAAMWQYYSGRPITYPAGTYLFEDKVLFFFSHRNANRLPDYHRLDLSLSWHMKNYKIIDHQKIKKKWQSYWNISVYNAYARDNTFMIQFKYNEDTEKMNAYKVTLFKIVPAISYHFKF